MSFLSKVATPYAATDAEALYARLELLGAGLWLVVLENGRPFLVFQSSIMPMAPEALDLAKLIRSRFFTEPQFQRDLFGWAYVEGRVLQRYAEHQPRIQLDEAPA